LCTSFQFILGSYYVTRKLSVCFVRFSWIALPNVIPEEASVWLWIRDSKRSGVTEVTERMNSCQGRGINVV
jgi:metal-dependent amidase/aminoacylase/carboxypeptidase family protein